MSTKFRHNKATKAKMAFSLRICALCQTPEYILLQVIDRSCLNKMTSSNLAVVFGPNLTWSADQSISLSSIGPINAFTDYLLSKQDAIFI